MELINLALELTAPGPSVDGPPTNAIILAPEPGTHTPKRLAATLNAAPVHLDARWSAGTGQGSFWSSSITYMLWKKSNTEVYESRHINISMPNELISGKLQQPDST